MSKELRLEVRIPGGYYAAGTLVDLRDSSGVLKEFDGTPDGVVCPRFWRLSIGNQCRFECSYCFLQGTMRSMVPMPVLFMDSRGMMSKVRAFLDKPGNLMLNVGELSDSLDFDDYTGVSRWLVPMFGRQSRHELLMLTKSENVELLLGLEHNGMTTVSFSLNARAVAYRYEGVAPFPMRRILAARRVQDAAYPIRLRIDPMVPISTWKYEYDDLVSQIKLAGLKPEVITLGSLRFMPSVEPQARRNGRNLGVFRMVRNQGDADRRARVDVEERVQMYKFMVERLAVLFPGAKVGLCKETDAVREEVGIAGTACNCTVTGAEKGVAVV